MMKPPINRARMAQERTPGVPRSYPPGSSAAKRVEAQLAQLPGAKPWRRQKVPKPKYVVLLIHTRNAGVHVVGPYDVFKRAEGDAKAWSIPPWSASVEPLVGATVFSFEDV